MLIYEGKFPGCTIPEKLAIKHVEINPITEINPTLRVGNIMGFIHDLRERRPLFASPEAHANPQIVVFCSASTSTRIKRLVRRTRCFSKTERMHELVIGLFINRYAFGVAV